MAENSTPPWKRPRYVETVSGEPQFRVHAQGMDPAHILGSREGQVEGKTVSVPWAYYERWIDAAGNVVTPPLATTRVGVVDGGAYKTQMENARTAAGWVHYDNGPRYPIPFAISTARLSKTGPGWPEDREEFISERLRVTRDKHDAAVAQLRGETDPKSLQQISQLTEAIKAAFEGAGIRNREEYDRAISAGAASMAEHASKKRG